MQCLKCRYEPTMAELQKSPDVCTACSVPFALAARSMTAAPSNSRRIVAIAVFSLLITAALVLAGFWGHSEYKRGILIDEVEQSMRAANGFVSEILDDKALLTNGQFLQKIPRRIAELDSLLASTLAINDREIPGLTVAAAAYVRSSRSFLNAFTDDLRLGIQLSLAEAGHKAYESYPMTLDGARYLAMTQAEIQRISTESLAAVQAESDLSKKIDLLSKAAEHGKQQSRRTAYLKSAEDVRQAKSAKSASLKALHKFGNDIQRSGNKVSELSGRQMPTQAWGIPGM